MLPIPCPEGKHSPKCRNNEVQNAGLLEPFGCTLSLKVPAGDSQVALNALCTWSLVKCVLDIGTLLIGCIYLKGHGAFKYTQGHTQVMLVSSSWISFQIALTCCIKRYCRVHAKRLRLGFADVVVNVLAHALMVDV